MIVCDHGGSTELALGADHEMRLGLSSEVPNRFGESNLIPVLIGRRTWWPGLEQHRGVVPGRLLLLGCECVYDGVGRCLGAKKFWFGVD